MKLKKYTGLIRQKGFNMSTKKMTIERGNFSGSIEYDGEYTNIILRIPKEQEGIDTFELTCVVDYLAELLKDTKNTVKFEP